MLMAHEWPGNIRELENIIEHAFVLCSEGMIEPRHLPHELVPRTSRDDGGGRLASTTKATEVQALMDALRRNKFNRVAAARDLGIHKSTLYRKLRSLRIELPPEDGRSRAKHRR